jgi:beta-glucosidase
MESKIETLTLISPWSNPSSKPLFAKENNSAFTYFIDGIPKEVPVRGHISVCSG